MRHAFVATALLSLALLVMGAAPARFEPRLTLDVKDADLQSLLSLFATVGRINLVTSDSVRGKVTIHLRNVHWRQALEAVLVSKGLQTETVGEILWVAPAKEIEAARQAELKAQQQLVDRAPLKTQIVPVNYAKAKDLVPFVKATLSERGTVTYDERTNVLIIRDVEP